MVHAPAADHLTRHREPLTGQLCLLSDHDAWDPTMLLAEHLTAQLPKLLASNAPGHRPAERQVEAPEPEPVTAYMRGRWPRLVLVDGGWQIDDHVLHGTAVAVLRRGGDLEVLGRVQSLSDAEGRSLCATPSTVTLGSRVVMPWARVETPPADVAPEDLWQQVTARAAAPPGSLDDDRVQLVVAVVREEVRYREFGDSLVLLVRGRADRRRRWQYGVVLTERAGREDLAVRSPETAPLATRRVLVCGLGALGGPAALDLARAGVGHLDLLDGDIVTAGTVPRQLAGLEEVDLPKVVTTALRVLRHAPFCEVRAHHQRLGSLVTRGPDVLDLLDEADLVLDCTASPLVTRFLAAHASASGTPLLVATATGGAWGGTVTRLPASGGGCWRCLELHRADGTVVWPRERPNDSVRPLGCSEPTFTGTAVHLAPVWQLATAMAVDALSGLGGAYDDVAVLHQRTADGRPVPPMWSGEPLVPHAGCPDHDAAVQLPLFST